MKHADFHYERHLCRTSGCVANTATAATKLIKPTHEVSGCIYTHNEQNINAVLLKTGKKVIIILDFADNCDIFSVYVLTKHAVFLKGHAEVQTIIQ